ncbi:MAG: FAD-binding protein [Dehalococcoidia bacterium]|nr:FAD-binding protein [Dehalococcoidia bacterium]MDW8119590.1 FAD-linked oxidase C-terminal domain-containing protein [Chloroflexota bacterium]
MPTPTWLPAGPISRAKAQEVEARLKGRIKGEVRFDAYAQALYSTDASIYQMVPVGVVLPKDAEDVQRVVEACRDVGVPLLPRGGGTSLAGQGCNHAVVIDFTKYMHQVLEVNPQEGWARVQPGITIDELNATVRPYGLHFAPDPTTTNRATVGGASGNNSCGAHSILYGKTVDHVLAMEAFLADGTPTTFRTLSPQEWEAKLSAPGMEGNAYRTLYRLVREHRDEILRRYPKIQRRVGGYNLDLFLEGETNLCRLIVGSEGTLAVYTALTVRLVPLPKRTGLAILHYRTLFEAGEDTPPILEDQPAAIELVDDTILRQARTQLSLARRMGFVQGEPGAILVVEVFGESEAEVRSRLERIQARAQRRGLAYAVTFALTPAQQADVWAVRRGGLGLLMGIKGDTKPLPFVEDTAVDPSRLPAFIREFDAVVRAHGTSAAYYGHASVGCLHIRPLINLKTAEGLQRMESIANAIADLVLRFEGALSGEHGDGRVRGVFNEKMFGPRLYQAFREVKRAFDPQNILNPGKIVDCPPLTTDLRFSPSYRTVPIRTHLDFSADRGFDRAVEMCNGVGACRKMLSGTMCPSYMVTREEEHSTRGRANALRAVLSGLLPPSEFTSQRLYQVLDLCLECKGCKAECESSVDMAKLKYEFLAHYYKAHGWPLRARLFAHIALLGRLGSATAPLSNWMASSFLGRWALARIGIHPSRSLPRFVRPTFSAWFRRHTPLPQAGSKGEVVLFHDTFMEYNHPSMGQGAVHLLERAGYRVVLARNVCCGRPMISKGMLDRAREHARRNVEILYPFAQKGIPIVGCEPPCLLTLRDEYPDLLPKDERVRIVAQQAMLLDTFLVRLAEQNALDLPLRAYAGKVLLHAHCHQKALVGYEASLKALRMVPQAQVEFVDAGCCGMAGAFGFEKEHYDISLKIGERRLFPAVRANPGAPVVVTGMSCFMQVEHGTGVRPLHLAEFLAQQMDRG